MGNSLHMKLLGTAAIRRLSLVLFLVHSLNSFSQTSNINGVVNSYYQVIEVIPAKACVRLNSVTGLARNQKVLLLQMKGASVITTNTSSYGDTTSLNNAGNYEVAIICSIDGDSVFMFHNLLNSYSTADKVQLVKFAEYYAAVVTDTVKASPWNNSTGTGGVIAISVSTTLTMNAPIYADSSGFRGGAFLLSNGTCSNFPGATGYIYDANPSSGPQNGGYKGESIFEITVQGQTGGRGAPANGGGGGNNHNNGGGGGSNLSLGGRGGGNSSSGGCTVTLRGEAGKAMSNWGGRKLFFGGGGGAGHANGILTISNGGGNGGGIIFIHADNIIGNGFAISANGGAGGDAVSDGASGGGGGGTIILDINNYTGSLTVQTNGGKGGDEDDVGTTNRCYGAGGGGSGGVIYFTGALPGITISTAGGVAGQETSSDPGCNTAVFPLNGSNGSTNTSYNIRQAVDSASYCLSIGPLPVGLIYFKAAALGSSVRLQWKIDQAASTRNFVVEKLDGSRWIILNSIPVVNGLNEYQHKDDHPSGGNNFYRIKMFNISNTVSISPVRKVSFKMAGDRYTVFPNPAVDQLTITGPFNSTTTVKLTTTTGKIVWMKKFFINGSKLDISLPALPPGIYSLHVDEAIKKLVIGR